MTGQVERLIELTNHLLYLVRLDKPGQLLARERVAAAELIAAVLDQVRSLAAQKGLQLIELAPADLTLNGSLDHLIRLMLILLDNAIKYTPAGGTITVSASQQGHEVCIAVADDGPGIPPEHLPHLFDRFYRVDSARGRQNGGGSGLGLAIAREIVAAHEGEITVASEVGRGTVFTVTLPAESA